MRSLILKLEGLSVSTTITGRASQDEMISGLESRSPPD